MPLVLANRTPGRLPTNRTTDPPAPASQPWLTRLLLGELVLPAFAPTGARPDRHPAEADAVARALACPDLFVIAAAERSARERAIADLLHAAAGRGERVLALSPDPAAADRLTEIVAGIGVNAVRALAEDENPMRPSPGATRLTSSAIGTGRVEALKRDVMQRLADLDAKLIQLNANAERLQTLPQPADQDAEYAALTRQREILEADIHVEADASASGSLSESLARLRTEEQAATAPLETERAAIATRQSEVEATLAALRQQQADTTAEAAKKGGFLNRLLHRSKPHPDQTELEHRLHDTERELRDLSEREAKLQAEWGAITVQYAAEREKHITAEVATRRANLETRLQTLTREKDQLAAERAALGSLTTLNAAIEEAKRERTAIRDRLDELHHGGESLVRRMLVETLAVIGTPGSVDADPVFTPDAAPFDLLVLDHAEELTERDFAHLSRLASRWVLVESATPAPARGEPALLPRLVRLLDCEPWTAEGERLVCRLVHLLPEQRRMLAREPVLDHPHIELRFTDGSAGEPVLAEVAFPLATPMEDVKAFLVTQLGEVRLRPCGECHWHPAEDRLTVCWVCGPGTPSGGWVDLEPGVREQVCGTGAAAFTAAVAFDLSAGWDEKKARNWLADHVPAPSAGRVAVLASPLRAAAPSAAH